MVGRPWTTYLPSTLPSPLWYTGPHGAAPLHQCSTPRLIVPALLVSSSGRQAARLFSVPHVVQQETTLAYLENQVAAALTLQSSHEYRHWLLLYARYLVNEGKITTKKGIC